MADDDRPRIEQFDDVRRSRGSLASVESRKNPHRVKNVATCDRVYTEEETEFLEAVRKFQEQTGRKFPTFSELFGVVKDLGYAKVNAGSNLDP